MSVEKPEAIPSPDEIFNALKKLRGRVGGSSSLHVAEQPALMRVLRGDSAIGASENLVRRLDSNSTMSRAGWAASEVFRAAHTRVEDRLNHVAVLASEKFNLDEQPESRTIRRWSDEGLRTVAQELHVEASSSRSTLSPLHNLLWGELNGEWGNITGTVAVSRNPRFRTSVNVSYAYNRSPIEHDFLPIDLGDPTDQIRDSESGLVHVRYSFEVPKTPQTEDALTLQFSTSMTDAYRSFVVKIKLPENFSVQLINQAGICEIRIASEEK